MSKPELIYEHPHPISHEGATYRVFVFGEQRRGGTWSGWIQFRDVKTNAALNTEQETSQPDRKALEYWATGVEDVYLQGAFDRAEGTKTPAR